MNEGAGPSAAATASTRQVRRHQALAVTTAFLALFSIVGFALYGLPFFYDFFFKDLGWTRQAVTSGNAYSKIGAAVVFGLIAGIIVDTFGPRRLMLVGIVLAGGALVGLSTVTSGAFWLFYLFYGLNALGYVFGGPLPNQVILSRYFDAGRGRAMGIAYLGIGIGGVIVLQLAPFLIQTIGWRGEQVETQIVHARGPESREEHLLHVETACDKRIRGRRFQDVVVLDDLDVMGRGRGAVDAFHRDGEETLYGAGRHADGVKVAHFLDDNRRGNRELESGGRKRRVAQSFRENFRHANLEAVALLRIDDELLRRADRRNGTARAGDGVAGLQDRERASHFIRQRGSRRRDGERPL